MLGISGRLFNFHSFHPFSMKKNVAKNFIHKVFTLTDKEFLRERLRKIDTYQLPDGLVKNLFNQKKYSVRGQTNTNQ